MNRAKHEQPLELIELLKQNFLQNEDGKWYVPDHNKATDLEKVRQRALLREFKEYAESSGRLRVFRSRSGARRLRPTVSSVRTTRPSSRLLKGCPKTCCAKIPIY